MYHSSVCQLHTWNSIYVPSDKMFEQRQSTSETAYSASMVGGGRGQALVPDAPSNREGLQPWGPFKHLTHRATEKDPNGVGGALRHLAKELALFRQAG